MRNRIFGIAFLLGSLYLLSTCNHKKESNTPITNHPNNQVQAEVNYLEMKIKDNKKTYHVDETIEGNIIDKINILPDSILLFVDGKLSKKLKNNQTEFNFSTTGQRMGKHTLVLFSYFNKRKDTDVFNYTLLNNVAPTVVPWKVLKKFPHDTKAYTQGLFFKDGYLFEGTGQLGQSSLRKLDLEKNEIIKSYNLPSDIFGEGIVAIGNKIIQISWQSHEAFEYDAETFKLINRFTYDSEGWGITNYNNNIIMSDGSNVLYILDPGSFAIIDKIEVYDDQKPIINLNELENINEFIFANVYQSDDIVVVNPLTGAVNFKINLKGLLSDKDRTPQTDVLNGIAWDKEKNLLIVTGKNWPWLFQLQLNELTSSE